MPFVQAKCENCGGILEVDAAKKAAICPYCGTPYVVQDAINNYVMTIGNLHADVVNVSDDKSARARLDAAEAFMKLRKYGEAWKAYSDVCSLTPQDYRGWWGKILVLSEDFSLEIEKKSTLDEILGLYRSAQMFIPTENKKDFEERFYGYYQPLKRKHTERFDKLTQRISEIKQEIRSLESEHSTLKNSIADLERIEYSKVGCMSNGVFLLCALAFGFTFVIAFLTQEVFFLIPVGILVAISIFWEIFIRPICNLVAASKEKRKKKVLEKKRTERDIMQKKLQQAQEKLRPVERELKHISG